MREEGLGGNVNERYRAMLGRQGYPIIGVQMEMVTWIVTVITDRGVTVIGIDREEDGDER